MERLGPVTAAQAVNRLADLRAAARGSEVVAGQPRARADGRVVITLAPDAQLVLRANHLDPNRNADWFTVDRVLVESLIVEDHESSGEF